MTELVVCLECGGLLDGQPGAAEYPAGMCSCPPVSVRAATVACPACGGPLQVGVRACPFCTSTLATTRCSSCTAWNLADARHCQACGKALELAAASGDTRTALLCPRCDARLHARDYASLEVSECDACGGMFIEPAMMDRIVASRDAPTGLHLALPRRQVMVETTVRYVRCPTCAATMNRQMFGRISGVVVDVCKNHGVWFDAGELSQVISFVESGGLERARARQAEELAQERRSLSAERARASTESMRQPLGFGAGFTGAAEIDMASELLDALASLWKAGVR